MPKKIQPEIKVSTGEVFEAIVVAQVASFLVDGKIDQNYTKRLYSSSAAKIAVYRGPSTKPDTQLRTFKLKRSFKKNLDNITLTIHSVLKQNEITLLSGAGSNQKISSLQNTAMRVIPQHPRLKQMYAGLKQIYADKTAHKVEFLLEAIGYTNTGTSKSDVNVHIKIKDNNRVIADETIRLSVKTSSERVENSKIYPTIERLIESLDIDASNFSIAEKIDPWVLWQTFSVELIKTINKTNIDQKIHDAFERVIFGNPDSTEVFKLKQKDASFDAKRLTKQRFKEVSRTIRNLYAEPSAGLGTTVNIKMRGGSGIIYKIAYNSNGGRIQYEIAPEGESLLYDMFLTGKL